MSFRGRQRNWNILIRTSPTCTSAQLVKTGAYDEGFEHWEPVAEGVWKMSVEPETSKQTRKKHRKGDEVQSRSWLERWIQTEHWSTLIVERVTLL